MKKFLYAVTVISFVGTADAMYRQTVNRVPLIARNVYNRGTTFMPKSCNINQQQRSFNIPSFGNRQFPSQSSGRLSNIFSYGNRQFNQSSGKSASWAAGLAGAGLGLGAGYYLSQDNSVLAEEPFYYNREFKRIKDVSGIIDGKEWAVQAVETPTEFRIYVKNPGVLFNSWGEKLSFRVSSEGGGIQAVYHKKHNPKEFAFGPTGGFDLPHPAAKELWTTRQKYSYIEPIQISENEIELIIPKDQDAKPESSFDNWFNPRKLIIWADNLRKPGDPISIIPTR